MVLQMRNYFSLEYLQVIFFHLTVFCQCWDKSLINEFEVHNNFRSTFIMENQNSKGLCSYAEIA